MMIRLSHNIKFASIQIEQREQFNQLLRYSDFRGCEYNFNTMFLWRDIFHTQAALFEDRLIVRSGVEKPSYLFPVGSGDLKTVLLALEQIAQMNQCKFRMHSVNRIARQQMEAAFPGKYYFFPSRNDFDYIYSMEKLKTLQGKKLHGKRNHINRFLKTYEGRWEYEPITKENLHECWEMNHKWFKQNASISNDGKQQEQIAVKQALARYFELNLSGGLLRVDHTVAAFSIGEPLNSDTFLVHIEKGLTEYSGVYPMINQQFVTANCSGFEYVNREDDAGSEGLRKSKMSYYPAFLETKYLVWLNDELTYEQKTHLDLKKNNFDWQDKI